MNKGIVLNVLRHVLHLILVDLIQSHTDGLSKSNVIYLGCDLYILCTDPINPFPFLNHGLLVVTKLPL